MNAYAISTLNLTFAHGADGWGMPAPTFTWGAGTREEIDVRIGRCEFTESEIVIVTEERNIDYLLELGTYDNVDGGDWYNNPLRRHLTAALPGTDTEAELEALIADLMDEVEDRRTELDLERKGRALLAA